MTDRDFARKLKLLLAKARSDCVRTISDEMLEKLIADARHKLRLKRKAGGSKGTNLPISIK